MDPINTLMNWAAPLAALLTLILLLPTIYLYKTFVSFLSSLVPEDMNHKVVLITGASSGIGEQLAYQYAKKGAMLVLVARRESSLREVAERAMEMGSPDAYVVPADVSKADDCRRMVDATKERFGRLDHLVTNSGIANLCMLEEATDVTNFTTIMDVNFWGSVYTTYYALPHLKLSKGRIVVNSSSFAWTAFPRMSFYNASKAAVLGFYETLRNEVAPEIGITIATPGWIKSEMTKGKFLDKEGKIGVDQDIRDCHVGVMPVLCAEDCAKAIVDGACRGDRHVTEPTWYKVLYLFRMFVPEVMDLSYRLFYLPKTQSQNDTPGKMILDATGLKKILYPESIQKPETKAE